jgi:hypothetical protein
MLSMLFFAAAAASNPPRTPAAPAGHAGAMTPVCQEKGPELVGDKTRNPVGAQKLNTLPNADVYQTVVRLDSHGCSRPSIIGYDVGGNLRKKR